MASISQLSARLVDLFGPSSSANPTKLLGNLGVSPNGNVVMGAATSTDNGTDKLQVTGSMRNTNGPFVLAGPAATYRIQYFQSGTTPRWSAFADNIAETGSNAGSNYVIGRYNDAGAWVDNPIFITRSTGQVQFPNLTQTNGGIQLPNGVFVYALDSTGTSRQMMHLSTDNHPTIVNSYGSYIRFVNQAYNIETFKVDNTGAGTFAAGLTVNGGTTITGGLTVNGGIGAGASVTCGSGAYQFTAYTTNAIASTGAFHVANDIGTSYAAWNTTATCAVQLDAPNPGAAYLGLRWTHWGVRHVGGITAYEGGNTGTTCNIGFLYTGNGSPVQTFYDGGNVTFNGTLTQGSDYRIKTNVQDIEIKDALNGVLSLRPVTYDRTDMDHNPNDHSGFIAHELQSVFPNLVNGEKDAVKTVTKLIGDTTPHRPGEEPEGYVPPVEQEVVVPDIQTVNYIGMVPYLVAAMQELKRELDETKAELAALKANNNG